MASIPQGYFIYGLSDPTDDTLHYIGQTTVSLAHRLRAHMYSARRTPNAPATTRAGWVYSLLDRQLQPHIRLIESVASAAEMDARERHWIAYYRAAGAPLVNGNPGGTGAAPGSPGARSIGDKTGKTYTGFIDPNGEPLTITNMKRFCEAHGLIRKSMMDVYHGRKLHHHGYGHERTAGQAPKNIKQWSGFIRPDGTREPPIAGIRSFCALHGLHASRVWDLIHGKCQSYRGWRYEELNE